MRIILFDSAKVKKVNEAVLSNAPHVIYWNGLTYVRFGIQDTSAFYEEATTAQL